MTTPRAFGAAMLLAAAAVLAASAVQAQPQIPQPPTGPQGVPNTPTARERVYRNPPGEQRRAIREQFFFISPSGEPFRTSATPGPSPIEQWFNGADTNHDGAIDHDEFLADAMRFFAVLDRDHDGMISGFENQYYEVRIAPEITVGGPAPFGESLPPPDPNTGRRAHTAIPRDGAARFTFLDEPQPIRNCDTNLDWQVSSDEWRAASERRFRDLDTQHNGRLTLATLPVLPLEQRR